MPYCEYFFVVLATTCMVSVCMSLQESGLLKTLASIDKDTAEQKGQNATSIEKYFTSTEKDGIVQTMNDLRRTVGAADMTYLDWSTQMENDASTFTAMCNFDAATVTYGWGMKQHSTEVGLLDPVALLKDAFDDPLFYYGMRSVYLLGIGVNIRFCSAAQVHNELRSNIYIGCYLFSYSSNFRDYTMQYSIGPACTECRSYVFWCDGGLCRGDCTSHISTCSCYTTCANCSDWNTQTCICPGRPYSDAVALACRGETMHLARRDLWITIVLSTFALLFYLQ